MGLLDWLLNKDKVPELSFREDPSTGAIYVEMRKYEPATPSAPVNDARWYLPGEMMTIHGITLTGGRVYVGSVLQSHGSYGAARNEPSLINPSLEVASTTTDQPLLYWRSYTDLTPLQRATYLSWLSTERSDSSIDIHYVYLYFFGLERRVLTELAEHPTNQDELLEIRAEVTRLLTIYGPVQDAFRDDANMLLEIIDVLLPPQALSTPPPPPPLVEKGWEIPLSVRVRIGQFAAKGTPIPPEWALAWVWYHPETRLRTPTLRCTSEFSRLFARRYTETYGLGLKARPGKARMRGAFKSANFSLGAVPLDSKMVPNTFEHKAPVRKLREVFIQASDELDAYSRWIGRNPDRIGTLPALAQLPDVLIDNTNPAVRAFDQWARGHLSTQDPARIPGSEIVTMWAGDDTRKLTRAQSVAVLDLAQRLGFGFEPDVRFGGAVIGSDDPIVLFRVSPHAQSEADPTYASAQLLVHLAAVVAAADGQISRSEVGHLGAYVASNLELSPASQNRLFAHLLRLAATDIRLTGLKKRIDPLPADQRKMMGDVLVALASTDGSVTPEEIKTLIKIFKLLGLDSGTITSRIHASLAGGGQGSGIDTRPQITPDMFVLDPDAVARIQAETASVSSLLSDIFIDDELAPLPIKASEEVGITFQSLDKPHSQLLTALGSREEWPRAEYEELANRFHLMPGGAIDVINDIAFDIIGDPIIEGEDILTINIDLIEELRA